MKKNPHSKILKGELKEQYLITVPKSYSIYIYIYILEILSTYGSNPNDCSLSLN